MSRKYRALAAILAAFLLTTIFAACQSNKQPIEFTLPAAPAEKSIPPLPADLQKSCPTVTPRAGKSAKVELYRALIVLDQCSNLQRETAQFYTDIRHASLVGANQ